MRVFNGGWRNKEVNEGLKLLDKIISETKSVKAQLDKFQRQTKKSRSIFFRYKAFLNRKSDTIGNQSYQKHKENSCYFCEKEKGLLVHHKNLNKNNNSKENLLTLCPSCHVRLHLILKSIVA